MKKFKIKLSDGFSTLEMLIAMTILIMVLGAIIFVIFGNQSLSSDSQTNAEALNKAQAMLEEQQALSRKDFKLVNPTGASVDGIYQKSVAVTNLDFFTKKITSTVAWTGEHNRAQSVDLTSLVTNFENAIGGDTCYSVLSGDWMKPKLKNTGNTSLAAIVGDAPGSYPITDIDAYQGKLYVSVNNSAAVSAGANNPNTTVSSTTGPGSASWTNPNSSKVSDNSRATAVLSSGNTTRYLKATSFGFSIPNWATITGIKVEVERSIAGTISTGVKDSEVKIIKGDGTVSANNKADASSWPVVGSEAYITYNPSDLWGETWSPADINDTDFGVAISATATSSRTAQIDHVRITVTYIRQFYALNTSNPASPTLSGSLGSNIVTTGINALATNGKYAYLATNSSANQFQVVDMSASPYKIVSIPFKLGTAGSSVGSSIFYKNGYVYLGLTQTSGGPNQFNVIDVHDSTNPILVASAAVGNTVNGIYVLGNYAYVASPNTNDLLLYDVGINSLTPTITSIANFSGTGGLHGKSIYAVGDTAYLGRTFGTNELYILDTGALPAITDLGHIDIGTSNTTSVNSLLIRDYLAFFINTGGQFQIWRIDNPSSIVRYDTTPITSFPSGGNNTPLDCEGNYLYAAYTDSSNKGFINVIAP